MRILKQETKIGRYKVADICAHPNGEFSVIDESRTIWRLNDAGQVLSKVTDWRRQRSSTEGPFISTFRNALLADDFEDSAFAYFANARLEKTMHLHGPPFRFESIDDGNSIVYESRRTDTLINVHLKDDLTVASVKTIGSAGYPVVDTRGTLYVVNSTRGEVERRTHDGRIARSLRFVSAKHEQLCRKNVYEVSGRLEQRSANSPAKEFRWGIDACWVSDAVGIVILNGCEAAGIPLLWRVSPRLDETEEIFTGIQGSFRAVTSIGDGAITLLRLSSGDDREHELMRVEF